MARPKRKQIPQVVKTQVLARQKMTCAVCGEVLDNTTQFDHRPSIIMRHVNVDQTDYHPPQNDPEFIEALHARCHMERTVGRRRDAAKTVTTIGSDMWLKAKFARLEKPPKNKRKIPSRPFPKSKRRI
jgi:hypothetical protein